jgi:hypothetical protein
METWDREQLYSEIWEAPLVKLGVKYGISAVALGKVARKLQIPLPGRGYWTKKDFGKPIEREPLPEATNLPVVHRMKTEATANKTTAPKAPEPTVQDPELLRIAEIEADSFPIDFAGKQHKIVSATARTLKQAQTDQRQTLQPPRYQPCLNIRVSKSSLDRALAIVNTILLRLETKGLGVAVQDIPERAGVEILGHRVSITVSERTVVKSRREIPHGAWTSSETEYEPTGELHFRAGPYLYGRHNYVSDKKGQKLESILSRCVALLMREARSMRLDAEAAKQREIENEKRREELRKLRALIDEEEKKVGDLDRWVANWARAEQMRGFVIALEKVWAERGYDLSPEAQKGQRILWMKQQADRLDPLIHESPL